MPRPNDWRRFGASSYRPFQAISAGQAFVAAFAADALFIPFLLTLGAPAWLATLTGALPLAGSVISAANPAILARVGGNLRGLTLMLAAADVRGLAYALVAAGVAAHVVPTGLAIAAVVLVVGVGQTSSLLAAGNVALWTAIVLPEDERRLVAPRLTVLMTVLSTAFLLPISGVLDAGLDAIGVWAYAALFAVGGLGGLLVPLSVRRLPRPGRISVARSGVGGALPPAFERFRRTCAVAALGQGLIPYTAVYALTVLHLTPGFAVGLSAAASVSSLAASVAVGSFLVRGSASRVLRASFAIRAIAAGLALLAVVSGPIAPVLILVATVLFNGGGTAGQIAQNERTFRLLPADAAVPGQGRFVASIAGAAASGALVQAGVLAVAGGAIVPAFAGLYAAAGLLRLTAAIRTEVSPAWRVARSARTGTVEAADSATTARAAS